MAIILAFCANITFAFASTLFTDFSKKISGQWINCFKLCVAFLCFGLSALVFRDTLAPRSIPYFLLSGALGLFAADHFLCQAFAKLGSSRPLMIFSFSPLFVAGWSYLFWGEHLIQKKLIAIVFLIACVCTLSFEKFRREGHWAATGLLMALVGVILDGLGNTVTSYGFRNSPESGVMSACALRASGAFIAFLFARPFLKINLLAPFKRLSKREKSWALISSFLGTYLALTFWISAVKIGNITTLVAFSTVTPLLAACFEIFMKRAKATRYLAIAFVFFSIGAYFLIFAT